MGCSLGVGELSTLALWRAVLAEFVGMTMFLLCVSTVGLGWGNSKDGAAINTEVGIGIGLAIASHAQAFGHVSGGHLNPAVTLGMVVARKVSIIKGLLYVIAQMVGAICGSGIVYGCTPKAFRESLAANLLKNGVSIGGGFGVELFFTFMLVFFVFSVTDPKKKVEPYGQTLGIGIIIWVAHVCIIPYTNCSINPARSFGPAVVAGQWDDHWIFWVAPLLGGVLAAVLYEFVFYAEDPSIEYVVTSKGGDAEMKVVVEPQSP